VNATLIGGNRNETKQLGESRFIHAGNAKSHAKMLLLTYETSALTMRGINI